MKSQNTNTMSVSEENFIGRLNLSSFTNINKGGEEGEDNLEKAKKEEELKEELSADEIQKAVDERISKEKSYH